MPELRKDPVIGRWVIISTERAKRPNDYKVLHSQEKEGLCPFCEGQEKETLPEVYAVRDPKTKEDTPEWKVRVIPSIAERFDIDSGLDRRGVGMYDVMKPVGVHEIIIESPKHYTDIYQLSMRQIELGIKTSVQRMIELEKDPRLKYCLLFKNHGLRAGGSKTTKHVRSQIIATPVTPTRVKEELRGARFYYQYKDRCIFCDTIRQELDEGARIVMDTKHIVAIAPFVSRFPFEIWIFPKKHSSDFINIDPQEIKDLSLVLKTVLHKLSKALNDPPYNYMLHTAPFRHAKRPGYWHSIKEDYHWHIEVTPRITQVAGFEWGSGFYINPTPPEDAAKYLRDIKL
ncbi:MAG: galactose-1-phosphate uridylyltransferase [Candidatus Omnitrophota bacterium]|jgi:UDPglucose--hexose-1-phosphate uridylyltransferase|nr:galactose-1-phosphate uridylyltransferase [Candidatus Omnitrophota bacterium]